MYLDSHLIEAMLTQNVSTEMAPIAKGKLGSSVATRMLLLLRLVRILIPI